MKNDSMGLCQQLIILLEAMIHQWNPAEFQSCILKHVGSNERASNIITLFENYDLERIGVRKSSYFRLYLRIVVGALIILIPMIADISADISLLINYGSNFENAQVSKFTLDLSK